MKRREWLRILLGGIAGILSVGCLIVGFEWMMMAMRLSAIRESRASIRKDAAIILPLVEGELYALPKEEVLKLLHETLIKDPEYGIRQITKNCVKYDRVYFAFKEEKFSHFDKGGTPECKEFGLGDYRLFYSGER